MRNLASLSLIYLFLLGAHVYAFDGCPTLIANLAATEVSKQEIDVYSAWARDSEQVSDLLNQLLELIHAPPGHTSPSFNQKRFFEASMAIRQAQSQNPSQSKQETEVFSAIREKWSNFKKLSESEYFFLIDLLPELPVVRTYKLKDLFRQVSLEAEQLPIELRTSPVHPDLITNTQQTDLAGIKVYHGTTIKNRPSVLEGPKNISNGTGGKGLYLALEGDYSYAASHTGNRGDGIVMGGRLNPSRNFRVLRVQINNSHPDIFAGQFPHNWAAQTELADYVLNNFDIVEVFMYTPASINGRFIVVTERAGKDAIVWEN